MNAPEPWKNWNVLIDAVVAGDAAATAAFGSVVGVMARMFFRGLGLSPTAAEDMAVSCATVVTTKLEKFDGRHFSAWAHTVFRNFLAEEMRNQPKLVEPDDTTPWETPMWDGLPGHLSQPARGVVAVALAQLDEQDQRIIALRCGREPLEFRQIAIEVGVLESTARGRHKRALAKLEKWLRADPRMKERIARCGMNSKSDV